MATPHNILGIDYGERRIGLALASLEARMATPLTTLDIQRFPNILEKLEQLIEENEVVAVVVGLPRGMEGQETAQTASARQFADQLKKLCHIPVHLQDEAATSLVAEDELKVSGQQYDKSDIDKLAAAIILRDWLMNTEVGAK